VAGDDQSSDNANQIDFAQLIGCGVTPAADCYISSLPCLEKTLYVRDDLLFNGARGPMSTFISEAKAKGWATVLRSLRPLRK
jgi:hypothetical protein